MHQHECDHDHCEEDHFIEDNHTTFERSRPKLGRNDPCLCGSGKKFKKCCLQSSQ